MSCWKTPNNQVVKTHDRKGSEIDYELQIGYFNFSYTKWRSYEELFFTVRISGSFVSIISLIDFGKNYISTAT